MNIAQILKNGEGKNVEFKSFLSDEHLEKGRRERLVSQMMYRLNSGNGMAIYCIGVNDDGSVSGLGKKDFEKTLDVLYILARDCGAEISEIEKYENNGIYAKVVIEKEVNYEKKKHLIVGTLGHVDHGKSTLLGTLITGIPDDGSGKTRIFSDVLPHEIERGLSAEISHLVFAYNKNGTPIYSKNPLNKKETAQIIDRCYKFISFVDLPGHAPWLRTTIRGILGQKIDCALLTVSVEDGITPITKEHLGIVLGMKLPVIVTITKIDKSDENRIKSLERDISRLLRKVGRIPYKIKTKNDAEIIAPKISSISPILRTSAVTKQGLKLLEYLLFLVPEERDYIKDDFLMYIDKVFRIRGTGTVVSGTVGQGILKVGQELKIGPFFDGYKKVKATSIMQHHYLQRQAFPGDLIGVAVKGIKPEDVRRGMILTDANFGIVWKFLAEVLILNHPTRIKKGYEPILHLNTISETVIFEEIFEKEFLCTGDVAKVKMRFKYHPYFVREGDQFIFRESRSKGIGGILKVIA